MQINILKNPEFVFEFHKSDTVNSSLTTVGQVLMDSCSLSAQHLGKHSPANKHLYRSEVDRYKEAVKHMYKSVRWPATDVFPPARPSAYLPTLLQPQQRMSLTVGP